MNKKNKLILYSSLLKFILNSIFLTCKWKIVNQKKFEEYINSSKPILLCFWHEQLLCVSRYFKNNSLNLYGISSTHFDSEVFSHVLSSWNIKLIRGSSTRGWFSVLKKMLSLFKNNSTIIALSNDGPQGPPRIAKEGSLAAAHKSGAQIVCVSADISNLWKLNTWDGTLVPRPFSTIFIKFSDAFPSEKTINSQNITHFINENSYDFFD